MKANEVIVNLPKTKEAITREFPGKSNKGLREDLYQAACRGGVLGKARTVALTANGLASLEEVESVRRTEFAELGFDQVFVGEGDPTAYGHGVAVAYLNQPAK